MNVRRLAPHAAFLALAALVYLAYRAGFRGDWQFDDALNLAGLAAVRDLESALAFVTGGLSSALGRPLALAAFLINLDDWPCCTEGFRRVNTLIHLGNGLLVYLLARRVAALAPLPAAPAAWLPVTLAGAWLAHPLLVSGNLFAVQRMTSLSATFVLLGLLGYLAGRARLMAGRLRSGYAWLSASLAGGTLLGVLVKESAALLPLYAAVAEVFLLQPLRPLGPLPRWRAWRGLFFGGPLALLLAYTALHWPAIAGMAAHRPFDLAARLASEAVILWDYLRQILVPDISVMGPYHDDAVVRSWRDPLAVLAAAAWLAAAALAWRWRRRQPLPAFALAWFAVGQLLESTVFPLELYFEHRNYLASLGPLALAVVLLWRLPARLAGPVAALLVAVLLLLTQQTARVWGQPGVAAAAWFQAHPGSPRASKDLAGRLAAAGHHAAALEVLATTLRTRPLDGDLNLDALLLHCLAGDRLAAERQLAWLTERAGDLRPGQTMLATLHNVVRLARQGGCGGLDGGALHDLAGRLLDNPGIRTHRRHRHVLHVVLSDIARQEGDLDATVRHLEAAFQAWPQIEVAQIYIADLISAGLRDEARRQIGQVRAQAPGNPWQRRAWLARLDELERLIEEK